MADKRTTDKIKKEVRKEIDREMKKEVKKKVKKEIKKAADDREEKKNSRTHKASFDKPSEKLIHQILPFVFIVLAILFEACFVLATVTGEEYVGIAGVFLKNIFLGLFGFCAFVIPLMLINLAANWRKFVDTHVVGAKVLFTVLFLASLGGFIHIFVKPLINPDTSAFLMPLDVYQYSYSNIASSGIIGGMLCECVYALFKSVGTAIIMAALSIMFLIFSLGMTPRDMGIHIRYKWTLMREKQKENNMAI